MCLSLPPVGREVRKVSSDPGINFNSPRSLRRSLWTPRFTEFFVFFIDSSLIDVIIAVLQTDPILCNTDNSEILADDKRNWRALIEAHVVLNKTDCETKEFARKNGVECEWNLSVSGIQKPRWQARCKNGTRAQQSVALHESLKSPITLTSKTHIKLHCKTHMKLHFKTIICNKKYPMNLAVSCCRCTMIYQFPLFAENKENLTFDSPGIFILYPASCVTYILIFITHHQQQHKIVTF